MKRLLSLAIIASLMASSIAPALAIQDTKVDVKQIKTEKVKPTLNKYEYINLAWWEKFNDPLMVEYIIKATHTN